MPCCEVVNRGAALFHDLAIFATLDAQLMALDQATGDVAWKEKIEDYAAGYSATAAPIIANGLLLTGVSGGEFGVVGRVEACDSKTGKMVWSRPTVEGHMGYTYGKDGKDGKKPENSISGTTNKTWPGDLWKTGGAATWLGGSFDPKTGRIKWSYQGMPNNGWGFDGVNEFVTFDMDGKRMGGKADRNGFFYVLDANSGKLESASPFVKKITWATGIDLKTGRPNFVPENRPGDSTASADGKKGNSII